MEEVPDSDKKEEKQEEGRDSPPTLDLMTPLNTQAEPGNEQEMEVAKPGVFVCECLFVKSRNDKD